MKTYQIVDEKTGLWVQWGVWGTDSCALTNVRRAPYGFVNDQLYATRFTLPVAETIIERYADLIWNLSVRKRVLNEHGHWQQKPAFRLVKARPGYL